MKDPNKPESQGVDARLQENQLAHLEEMYKGAFEDCALEGNFTDKDGNIIEGLDVEGVLIEGAAERVPATKSNIDALRDHIIEKVGGIDKFIRREKQLRGGFLACVVLFAVCGLVTGILAGTGVAVPIWIPALIGTFAFVALGAFAMCWYDLKKLQAMEKGVRKLVADAKDEAVEGVLTSFTVSNNPEKQLLEHILAGAKARFMAEFAREEVLSGLGEEVLGAGVGEQEQQGEVPTVVDERQRVRSEHLRRGSEAEHQGEIPGSSGLEESVEGVDPEIVRIIGSGQVDVEDNRSRPASSASADGEDSEPGSGAKSHGSGR